MSPFLRFIGFVEVSSKIKLSKVWLIFLLPLFIASCNKKETASADYSDAFKSTFKTVTHYFDLNQPDNAISYLKHSYASIKNPTINDRFRFYGFNYVYWQKAKLNFKKAL